jgi:hypothetical protein
LRRRCLLVTFLVLRLPISPKTSRDLRHVPFCTSNFNYLKNAQCLFYAGRALLVQALRPNRASSASCHQSSLLRVLPSGIRSLVSLRFPFAESPSWLLYSYLERSGCNQSDNESIFQSKHIRSTFLPLRAFSLAREDFLRKLSGTCEPFNLRPSCYNIRKNTWHLLAVRPALDCSLLA